MPKVTLLLDRWSNYTLAFGKGTFDFRGGRPKEVPVAVALEASKRKTDDGKPIFKVEDLPDIIEPHSVTEGDVQGPAEQNVAVEESMKARHLIDKSQSSLFAGV